MIIPDGLDEVRLLWKLLMDESVVSMVLWVGISSPIVLWARRGLLKLFVYSADQTEAVNDTP